MTERKKQQLPEIIFPAVLFGFIFLWAVVQPFDSSPDERMRYDIVEYIVRHGTLPHGADPEIRDANWGISYAFNPILAYMLMAVSVKIASFFTSSTGILLMAARLVNVCLGAVTGWIVLRIGKRLFQRMQVWLFAAFVMLLPGTLFVFSYVNSDGLAIFSTALILLFWVRSLEEGWTWANCIGLAAGIGLCALSYYNAYGVVLASVLFFAVTILMAGEKRWNFKFLFQRGLVITAVVLLIAGWWFVRSYIIYDGDFLGMRTSSACAELYAAEDYKPSNRWYVCETGMSVLDMFFYVPEGWLHNWLITVLVSFVGTFGYLDVFMPYLLSKGYFLVFGIGAIGVIRDLRQIFDVRQSQMLTINRDLGDSRMQIRVIQRQKTWGKKGIFHWCMALAAVIPFGLLVYYAYCSDFQAQGRYLLPGLIPVMYFVTLGIGNLLERFVKKEKIRQGVCAGLVVLLAAAAAGTYLGVFLPSC